LSFCQIWALEQLPPDDEDDDDDDDGGNDDDAVEGGGGGVGAGANADGASAAGLADAGERRRERRKSKTPRFITGASDSALKIWCVSADTGVLLASDLGDSSSTIAAAQ
jgi:hypothetical protein